MVRVLKYLFYLIFFIFVLIYFLPKENIYFYAEKLLEKEKIVLSSEKVKDKGFCLSITDAIFSYESIEVANVKKLSINIFALYNSIKVDGVELTKAMGNYLPQNINEITIRYSIINPLFVTIQASGEFGNLSGDIDIYNAKMSLKLTPSNIMKNKYKNSLKYFKKDSSGEYHYDKSI